MTIVGDLKVIVFGYSLISHSLEEQINEGEIDKKQLEYLERERKKHPVLEKVIRRETSPVQKVEELSKKYKGIKNYLPVFRDRKHDSAVEELSDLFSVKDLKTRHYDKDKGHIINTPNSTAQIIDNPFGLGLLTFGLMIYLMHPAFNPGFAVFPLRFYIGAGAMSSIMALL